MERFYIIENERPEGPFSIDELRSRGVSRDTQIWIEERSAWVPAGELSGFAELFYGPTSVAIVEEVTEVGETPVEPKATVPPETAELSLAQQRQAKATLLAKCATIVAAVTMLDTLVILLGLYLLQWSLMRAL